MTDSGAVLIVEPYASGHRMTYVRWIAEGARRAGCPVVIATSRRAVDNPVTQTLAARDADGIALWVEEDEPRSAVYPRAGGLLARQWWTYRWCRDSVRRIVSRREVSSVVLPYVDSSVYAIAVAGSPFGGLPWVGITMRTLLDGAASSQSLLRSRVMRRVAQTRGLKALFCINPSIRKMSNHASADGLQYLPDPAELRLRSTGREARRRLRIREDAFVLLVFGTIDSRKGLAQLLAGTRRVKGGRAMTILVAGTQSPELTEFLSQNEFEMWKESGQLVELNRFLDDSEVGAVFAAADAVWLGYVGHDAMSGVAVLASQAGLPIIACARGEIGRLASEFGIGPVVDVDDPGAVHHAIEELMDVGLRANYASRAGQAFAEHTPTAFSSAILAPLLSGGTND